MKKLKLNLANMPGAEVLSREQLRTIMGGDVGSGATGSGDCGTGTSCSTDSDCPDREGWSKKCPALVKCCRYSRVIIEPIESD